LNEEKIDSRGRKQEEELVGFVYEVQKIEDEKRGQMMEG
jgi:hypothetical protein